MVEPERRWLPSSNGRKADDMKTEQRVKIVNTYNDRAPDLTGTIGGMGHITNDNGEMIPVYLVKLDIGFWSHNDSVHHSFIPVHRESLQPIE